MDENIIIRNCDKDNKTFILNCGIKTNGIRLFVIKNAIARFAQITNEEIMKFADLHCLNFVTYLENLKQYFKETSDDISFAVSEDEFCVYRNVGVLKMKYFYTVLENCDYAQCAEAVIDDLLDKNITLFAKLNQLEQANNTLYNDKETYKEVLDEFIRTKEDNDKKLMSNFLLLLNAKKRRIQYLSDLLDAFKGGRSLPTIKTEKENANKRVNHTKREEVSDSGSDNHNSDDEPSQGGPKTAKIHPTTSREFVDFDDENSPPSVVKKAKSTPDPKPSTSKEVAELLGLEDPLSLRKVASRVACTIDHENAVVPKEYVEADGGGDESGNVFKNFEDDADEKELEAVFGTQDMLDML